MGSNYNHRKWDKDKQRLWVWRFIHQNCRVPMAEDFVGTGAPGLTDVIREFETLESLIDSSGPPKSANTVMPNNFGYLRDSFNRFQKENDHYPTAMEIDACKYFPRVRALERSWGGVTILRKLFGLEILDYSNGKSRSDTAGRVNKDALEVERRMEARMVEIYGEEFVHVERRWSKENKNRLDFYVYSQNGPFGIDVFNPSTIFNLKVEVLLKMRQYLGAQFPLFFVYANPLLDNREVDKVMANKKVPLPENIKVVAWDSFFAEIARKFTPRSH